MAVVWSTVHVPMEPPFTVMPLVQLARLVVFGLGFEVVGKGVYWYWQDHVESRLLFVGPVTVEVNTCVVAATTVAVLGLTVSTTVLAPEPPQPDCHNTAPVSRKIAAEYVRNLIADFSPISNLRASGARVESLKLFLPHDRKPFGACMAQKVRLTVKRNVLSGSK